jgi:formate dehydrogenase maturation protein FdhE
LPSRSVDDVTKVSLDLWADQHGYRRLRPNLLRL